MGFWVVCLVSRKKNMFRKHRNTHVEVRQDVQRYGKPYKDIEEINKSDSIRAKTSRNMKKHKNLKSRATTSSVCLYCGREYKSENLKHLLGCVEKKAQDDKQLWAFS